MRLRRLLAIVLLAGVAAVMAPAAASAGVWPSGGSAVTGPLHADGRWFRDAHGRTVILHGLFAVWKGAPYYPPDDATIPEGFTEADADRYAALGFDAVRLAWFWRGLEPARGSFDPAYLAGIAAVERKLSRRGVFVVLDSHQDGFGDRFNGLGFPDYVTFDDGLPFNSSLQFPLNYFSPATSRAFDNLYADRGDSWRYFGRAWQVMALRFARDPMLVGYDLMNEPWPGTDFGACSPPAGCPERDRTRLQPLFDSLAGSIRRVDRRRPVFYEPTIFFNQGAVNGYTAPPQSAGPVGLSFHNQCPTRAAYQVTHDPTLVEKARTICPPIETSVMQHAEETAARLGGPPLMTEVAATTNDDYDGLNCLLERSERFMTGYTYGLSWRSGELRNARPGQGSGDLPRLPTCGGRHPPVIRVRRAHRRLPSPVRDPGPEPWRHGDHGAHLGALPEGLPGERGRRPGGGEGRGRRSPAQPAGRPARCRGHHAAAGRHHAAPRAAPLPLGQGRAGRGAPRAGRTGGEPARGEGEAHGGAGARPGIDRDLAAVAFCDLPADAEAETRPGARVLV